MKVRFQSGSIRFRLRQAEAKRLAEEGGVVETIALGSCALTLALRTHDGAATLEFGDNRLTANVPAADIRRWFTCGDVGVYYNLPVGTRIMVEKDWACLEPASGESNDDTFPRPVAGDPATCRAKPTAG
jgi:hypothetical protein